MLCLNRLILLVYCAFFPVESQENNILIIHKLIFDISDGIDQCKSKSITIFIEGDILQYGIERFSIVLDQYGNRFFEADDMHVEQMFIDIFVDGIGYDILHQFLSAEINLV